MNQPNAQSTASTEPSRWTIARMQTFIATLRRTRNVAAAARAAGMSRRSTYRLRARLPGHPFDRAWEAAMAPRTAFLMMTTGYSAGPTKSRMVSPGDTG